jgi:hypothetical protein
MEQTKNKGGRPRAKINDEQLQLLMRLNPTDVDAAAIMGVSRKTIENHIKREHKMTFAQFREHHMAFTRYNLIKVALKKALEGQPALLIFCLKHFCGWSDNGPKEQQDNTIQWVYEDQLPPNKTSEGV